MGSRVGQEAIVTTPTEAARALQRLSVRSRWGKLTPAQRSEVMRRVRAAALKRLDNRFLKVKE